MLQINSIRFKRIIGYSSIILLVVYYLQGVLYPNNSFVAKVALAAFLAIGVFCMISLIIQKPKQKLLYVVLGFLLLNISYYGFYENFLSNTFFHLSAFSQIKKISFVLLSLYVFFYLSQNKILNDKILIGAYCFFFLCGIVKFYALTPFVMRNTKDVNNYGYEFINILPFLFIYKRKIVSAILLIISAFIVIASLKRGAIIILLIIGIYFGYRLIKGLNIKASNKLLIVCAIVMICSAIFLKLYDTNLIIQERVTQTINGDSSGRDNLYETIWNNWKTENSVTKVLFGNGFSSTPVITGGRFAHNDWLELLANTGLLGVGIYMLLFAFLFYANADKHLETSDRSILFSATIILFLKSLFSMGYTDQGAVPLMIMIGYVLGKQEEQNLIETKE